MVGAISTKSSAYSNSECRPLLASLETTSMTTANNSVLSTDPWSIQHSRQNSLSPASVLSTVQSSVNNAITVRMSHSSTPSFLKTHLTTSLGTSSSLLGVSLVLVAWWKWHQWFPCQAWSQTACFQLTPDIWYSFPTLSNTLIGCSSNLIALYEPYTSGSPFPLYTVTRILFLQSSGIQPSLTMLLIRSVIHLVPKPLDAFIISLNSPVGPAAFPIFNPLIAASTSSSEIRHQGPITSGQSTSPSQSFSTFRCFSIYFLHISSYRQHQTQHLRLHFSYITHWLLHIFLLQPSV